jgi:hypothetical protein
MGRRWNRFEGRSGLDPALRYLEFQKLTMTDFALGRR